MLLLKAWIKLDADILRLDKFVFQTYLSAYADLSWIMSTDGLASSTRDSLRLPRSFLALSFSRGRTWSKVLEIPYHQNSVIWIVAFCWSLNSKNHHAFACRPIHGQELWGPCSLRAACFQTLFILGPTKLHNKLHHAGFPCVSGKYKLVHHRGKAASCSDTRSLFSCSLSRS